MCCVVTSLFFLGPRIAIIVWWLLQPLRWSAAFPTFFYPLLGFIFLPWTTLMYVLVQPQGISGFAWILLGLALLIDVSGWAGGGFGNRNRVRGYSR